MESLIDHEKVNNCPYGAVGEHRNSSFRSGTSSLNQSGPLLYSSSRIGGARFHHQPPPTSVTCQNANSYRQESIVTARTPRICNNHNNPSNEQTTKTTEKRRNLRIKHFQEAFRRKDMELYVNSKLGNGKYSKVYKAYDMKFNRMIAIKAIELSQLSHDVRHKFLPREIGCWKKLKHQFIVGMHAQYEAGNWIFLAMEYAQHGDLLNFVQKHGALEEARAARYMAQLLMALDYMHSKLIAHRDIKLENIVIFDDGIKLSDFGFVRQMEPETLSNTFCGSKSYSSPELLRGLNYDPFLSDVWSAGVVGFIMLTDRMPFNESLPNHQIVEHQRTRHYHFSKKLNLSLGCITAIENMMTFSALSRPTSFQCLQLPWIASNLTNASQQVPQR